MASGGRFGFVGAGSVGERRPHAGCGLTADSSSTRLVELWVADLGLEGKLAQYPRSVRAQRGQLVMPAFERFSLCEISGSRVDQFVKALAAPKSDSTAKKA